MRRRLNPKHLNLTPDQEAELATYEAALTRARIIELGVGKLLEGAEYGCADEVSVAAQMLTESVELRRKAGIGRQAIRDLGEPVPAPRKRRVQ